MRLQDALDRYVVQLDADGRSEHTVGQYQRHVSLLARWLAQEGRSDGLDSIDHGLLAEFLTSPDARGSRRGGAKRATSMNALRTSLRTFFAYAHAASWTRENPARLVRRARCAGPSPRGLSDQDRDRLLAALIVGQGAEARRDQMLFELLLGTGLRLSAALALTDRDVDLQRGEITVQHSKNGRVERVLVGVAVRDGLVGYLSGRGPGPLFLSKMGKPLSRRHAVRRLAHWMKLAGLEPVSPHKLRATFAQNLYFRSGDILLVARALGHKSLEATRHYATANEGALRAALDAG